MNKRVLLAAPRSFCAGVDRAIEIVERLLAEHGPPIYVRHQIVHNENVVRRLERLGAVFVDDPEERARLHARTGAEAVDMESGPLARSGRLVGCLRAVSDTPTRRLGGVAQGATPEGDIDALGFVRGFVREPVVTLRAVFCARRALKSLEALT